MNYVKLGEICNIATGKYDANHGENGGDYPFYTCAIKPIKCPTYSFDGESIILPGNGANVGEVLYYNGKFEAYQRTYVLNNFQINSRFVYYQLKNKWKKYICNKQYGSATNYIRYNNLADFKIASLTEKEQQRIVNILDKADEIRTKKKLANEKLDEFLKSTFIDMFGDPEFNNKNWEKVVIRDVVKDVKYGTSSKAGLTGTYPILRMGNLTYNGAIVLDDLKYIDLKESEIDKYTVHKGDILFNRTNSKELVGKTAVYRGTNTVAFAGYLVRVRTNNLAHYEFLSAFMNSSYMKKKLQMKCKNIVGMANINAQEFQDFDIYLPPIDLQNKFAQIVQKVEAQKEKNQKVIEQMDNLFNSLMQQAFKEAV